jgi:hypothetical protein
VVDGVPEDDHEEEIAVPKAAPEMNREQSYSTG